VVVRTHLSRVSIACLILSLAAVLIVPAVEGQTGRGSPSSIARGKVLFVAACGSCHALAPAGTKGTRGPNLVDEGPSYGDVVSQIEEGGDGMPALGKSLTSTQIRAIATFVVKTSSSSSQGADD
jgi:mono/diheme cytochrome c family protein